MKLLKLCLLPFCVMLMFCGISISSTFADDKIEETDDEAMERYYREDLAVILSELKIEEGSVTIKPKGFRPMFVVEDFADLPDGWKAGEMTIVKRNEATKSYETIVFPNETVENYGMNIMKLAAKDGKVIAKGGISIIHAQNQKEAYREIFQGIMSTSVPIDVIVKDYKMPDDLRLGELCLSYGFEKNRDNVTIRRGVTFARDASAFSVSSITDDVSSLAKYLDAKYDALTKELNSPPVFRKWFMLDGIFSVEGKYVSSDLVKVVLADKDGKQSEIELTKLSPTDKLYTKRRYEINKATKLGKQTVLPEAIAGTKLNVTEPKIVFPNDLEYRKFESFDGQYFIEAKLVSFEIDKDNKKIVTLEKKDNHKKIPTHLDKLSKDDQNYIQEKIDTQKKNKLDPQPKH